MNLKKGNKLVMRDGRVAVMGTELFGAMSDNPGTEIAIEIDGGVWTRGRHSRGVGQVADMEKISGQKPVVTRAKKSVAGFKVREGWPIGCKVTLRRDRMYEFLERLLQIALPRERDFRGLNPKSFDGRGNYSMGVKEQIIFPEIDYDKVDRVRGLDICITTTAQTNKEALALLKAFNFPFRG